MNRTIILTGIVFGMLGVLMGAFGAHGLKSVLADSALQSFETGVRYQMYHAILLVIIGAMVNVPPKQKKWLYYFVTIGIVLFSFSIYALSINTLTEFDFTVIAFVTPIGGGFLLTGWGLFGYCVYKYLT